MIFGTTGVVGGRIALLATCATVPLSGCLRMPDIDQPSAAVGATSPERAAAIAEMRAQAAAGDEMPYPDAFQTAQRVRLAVREEPRSLRNVQEIEAELALIAQRRAHSNDPNEIAALDQRARQLRKLALAAGAEDLR
jgi:hypothetical protein